MMVGKIKLTIEPLALNPGFPKIPPEILKTDPENIESKKWAKREVEPYLTQTRGEEAAETVLLAN